MERFYRALRVLSVAALVLGVLTACLVSCDIWWSSQPSGTGVNLSITSASGLFALAMQPIIVGSDFLARGSCAMGITLAWLDYRKRWFVALIIVTLITFVLPNLLEVWYSFTLHQSIQLWFAMMFGGVYAYMLFQLLSPLIPVLATLAFARGTQQEHEAVEADLGITRSAL